MPDILNTSLTGMLAFQRALELTGHNIANANTPGYSRQVAEFSSRIGGGSGQNYIGGGTQITVIKRVYDALLGEQLQNATSGQARFEVLDTLASRVDTLLADADTGLSTGLQSFFNSVQDLGNDPSSIPIRQALIGEADGLANRFNALDQRLDEVESEVNDRLQLAVGQINQIAGAIAEINDDIALAGQGARPNDLLDQRDRLVTELSGLITVNTALQEDGAMNVFIGSGQSLVVGAQARRLGVSPSEFDPTRMSVFYEGAAGATALDTSLSGGRLGGLLEFRKSVLEPARQSLGQTAIAFTAQFNEQHASGMDLRGNLGGDFFAIDPPTVLYSSGNTGAATVSTSVTDLGALTGADYILEYDGASYGLVRADSGQPVTMTGSGTAADPFVADGISLVVAGAASAGDRMMIRSGHGIAGSLRNQVSDPQAVAMAAPTRSAAAASNIGSASISAAAVIDPGDPALLSSAVIEFVDPTTYTINGAGSFAYSDGSPIIINGSSVTISGQPSAGDQFTIQANYGASGDNSNGLLLTDIQSRGLLEGGTISINENYGRLVSGVGSTTAQIQANLDAQNVVLANAEQSMLSNSGVNLDEEAANLIRYQQAYQAAAQVVSVVQTLFDSLLNATQR